MSADRVAYTNAELSQIVESKVRSELLNIAQTKSFSETKSYPPVANIPESRRLRIAVTGGAGFVGSHLVDRLMLAGHQVTGYYCIIYPC